MRLFGTLKDGRPVRAARLDWPGGLSLEVLEYGAVVRSLSVPTAMGPVGTVLGLGALEDYVEDGGYQGCVVGRFGNRIADARFTIDGRTSHIDANEGVNTLHGGRMGFNKRLWRFEPTDDAQSLVLAYESPDGDEGFPGTLNARVTFRLDGPDTLTLVWEATADQPTPVNLTQHLYFNLGGEPGADVLDHSLGIEADAITSVRRDLIPTGALMDVTGSPFDLRRHRPLGEVVGLAHPQMMFGGFDHNWALNTGAGPACRLRSPRSGLSLEITTDQPGLQVYSGQGLGAPFAAFGGVAIEPQGFPNAVNTPSFPNAVLRPGETYRRWASYRFVRGAPGTAPP